MNLLIRIFQKDLYYLTKKKKHLGKIASNIIGEEHQNYNTPIERFSNISNWAINKFNKLGHNLKVFIEGYSYGSKGQALFQIAENCGILKYKLQERNIPYDIIHNLEISNLDSSYSYLYRIDYNGSPLGQANLIDDTSSQYYKADSYELILL